MFVSELMFLSENRLLAQLAHSVKSYETDFDLVHFTKTTQSESICTIYKWHILFKAPFLKTHYIHTFSSSLVADYFGHSVLFSKLKEITKRSEYEKGLCVILLLSHDILFM